MQLVFAKYYSDDQIKDDEMGGACRAYDMVKKFIRNRKDWRNLTT